MRKMAYPHRRTKTPFTNLGYTLLLLCSYGMSPCGINNHSLWNIYAKIFWLDVTGQPPILQMPKLSVQSNLY